MTEEPLPPPPEEELPPPPPEKGQEEVPEEEPEPPREPEPEPPIEPEPPREPEEFPDIRVKRSGAFATLRRAVTIFEKDLRTMAKHGLISSIILVIFLGLLFTISSVLMSMAVSFEFEGGDEGINLPGGTESQPPVSDPGPDRTVDAGTLVTLDGSGSSDNAEIVYYMWMFQDSGRDVDLYGPVASYQFMAAGEYLVNLLVVDSSWNTDEANFTLTVESTGADETAPYASAGLDMFITPGTEVTFNGTGSTDDVGVVNWTWTFEDVVPMVLYGEEPRYTFENANYDHDPYDQEYSPDSFWVSLTVRDEAGNTGWASITVDVQQSGPDGQPPEAGFETKPIVNVGDTVTLDASDSYDTEGAIEDYSWHVKHNASHWTYTGQVVTFVADEWGPYEIVLAVRDSSGNVATSDSMVFALPDSFDVDQVSWTSTPLGQDVSFNVLTYVYGAALLASVIFVGGLFAKGFAHEIQKGTVKVLFFGPVSVTTVIFSKLLYPIVIGPILVFPLMLVATTPFHQSPGDVLVITAVAYAMAVLVMLSAAYGSCLIYLAAKRMVVKPTIVTRIFMYLSLLATLTVFEWFSFLLDMQLDTEMWGDMYVEYGSTIATFSPFHQGGVLLSDLILGTGATMDLWVFLIPLALIAGGLAASRRLYPDLFSRE